MPELYGVVCYTCIHDNTGQKVQNGKRRKIQGSVIKQNTKCQEERCQAESERIASHAWRHEPWTRIKFQ